MKKGLVWLLFVLTLLSGLALADVTLPESTEGIPAVSEEPEGTPEEVAGNKDSVTGKYLKGLLNSK